MDASMRFSQGLSQQALRQFHCCTLLWDGKCLDSKEYCPNSSPCYPCIAISIVILNHLSNALMWYFQGLSQQAMKALYHCTFWVGYVGWQRALSQQFSLLSLHVQLKHHPEIKRDKYIDEIFLGLVPTSPMKF